MTAISTEARELYVGNRNMNPAEWTTFEWDDPKHGKQTAGELVMIRPEGTTGTLMCGLWRTGPGIAGCLPEGDAHFPYSAPLGDETILLLEGEAIITVQHSGKRYHFKAGDIFSIPKDLSVWWEPLAPFLKKFWVIWDSPVPGKPADDLYVGNTNMNPPQWTAFEWEEPEHGKQTAGELVMIRPEGSTGTLMAGLWRTGPNMPGCEPSGDAHFPYSAPLGDETIFLLEGEAYVTNRQTGVKHHFKAGDIFSIPKGVDVWWEPLGPFLKKFWVITDSAE